MRKSNGTVNLTRRSFLKAVGASIGGLSLGSLGGSLRLAPVSVHSVSAADDSPVIDRSPVFPNSVDPVESMRTGLEVRIPNVFRQPRLGF